MNLLKSRKEPQNRRVTIFAWCAGILLVLGAGVATVPGPSMSAQAAVGNGIEQVITFACHGTIENCAEDVDEKANAWLLKNSRGAEIVGRQASVIAGNGSSGYAVTIFYRE